MEIWVELLRAGHVDAGEYRKPKYQLRYVSHGRQCVAPIRCGGESKPLGQDAIDAIREYGNKEIRQLSDTEILDSVVMR